MTCVFPDFTPVCDGVVVNHWALCSRTYRECDIPCISISTSTDEPVSAISITSGDSVTVWSVLVMYSNITIQERFICRTNRGQGSVASFHLNTYREKKVENTMCGGSKHKD